MSEQSSIRPIRIGARRSPLAVAQAEWIAARLVEAGHPCELVGIDSLGDVDRRRLTEIGGTGIFATAVREHLLDGSIDVAVHSLKDLPVAPYPGLVVAAVPEREDVRDVLVGRGVDEWRDGTVVGTGSPRRAVQLRQLAAERGVQVNIVPVRGNVDTRLALVADGVVDATVLAAAGLLRLGRLDPASVTTGVHESQEVVIGELTGRMLAVDELLPAAGQGALAVECRSEAEPWLLAALADIDHAASRAAVEAERAFLSRLEAGCLAPVGSYAQVEGVDLTITAVAGTESADAAVAGVQPAADQLLRAQLAGRADEGATVGDSLARTVLPQLTKKVEESQ